MFKKHKKAKIAAIVVGCVVVGGGVIAVQAMKSSASGMPVEVTKTEKGDVVSTLNVTGDVTSGNTKTYYSPVNAKINVCNGEDGATVESGTLIIGYDTSTLAQDNQKAQLESAVTANGNLDTVAKAAQAAARTTRDEGSIQADIDASQAHIADLNVAIADRTNQLTSDASQYVTDATIAYENANAELTDLMAQLTDVQTKLNDKVSPPEEEEKKKLEQQVKDLTDQIEPKKAEVQELENEKTRATGETPTPATDDQIVAWNNELTQEQSTLSELQSELATAKSETKAAATAGVTDAAQAQMSAQNNLAQLAASTTEQLLAQGQDGMKTEFKGVLSDMKVKQGALVTQGAELFTVSSNEDVYVKVPVSKADYNKVQTGQTAKITIGQKEYKGTVTEISKIATKTEQGGQVINTKVRVDNADSDIYLGVQAKVVLNIGNVKDVLRVESAAVNTDTDGDFCYVVDESNKVVRKNVTIGLSATDYTEVKDGLKADEQVIRELPDGVEEGSVVTVQGDGKSDETDGKSGKSDDKSGETDEKSDGAASGEEE